MIGEVTVRKLERAELVVKIHISYGFRFRTMVGLWLMKLGAGLLPFNAKVERIMNGAPEVGIQGRE